MTSKFKDFKFYLHNDKNINSLIKQTFKKKTLLICTTIKKYVYIMLGEKVFTSKHGETIITILNVVQ